MNIAVCLKQVLDASVPLRVVNGAVQQDAPRPIMRLGAADRTALAEALALRARCGGQVTAVSAGAADAVDALRYALARGVDRAVQMTGADPLDPVASALAAAVALVVGPDLVLCGNASGDGASGRFAAELAARLATPLVTRVAAITPAHGRHLWLERRLERGERERVRCPLPAVLAVEPALAEAGYVSLRALRAAALLPIEVQVAVPSGAEPLCELIALEPARPRPKRISAPAAGLSAMDRLTHAITGGMQHKRSGEFVEGAPAQVAAEIVRFLEERGFSGERRGGGNG
ncbi:MAG: hypothetical protein HY699_17540 [Deltaproteobacteria bacterium]|nr:hypothetical protein [Deltaproteobacteria bacterium]